MTAPQKRGQSILFALLWPFAVEKKTPPLFCSIILNSTRAEMKTKASVIDSESLLAIGQRRHWNLEKDTATPFPVANQ